MTHRERFNRVFTFQPVDRIPILFFGTWPQTRERWRQEGYTDFVDSGGDQGPQLPGMDPDWEPGLWNEHGIVRIGPIGDQQWEILEKRDNGIMVVKNSLGRVDIVREDGASIPHTLTYPLEPTRESWSHFKKYFDVQIDSRYTPGWEKIADAQNARDAVTCFIGGSLYGWVRDYMGVEQLSYLMYDDPELLEEIIITIEQHMMRLTVPMLERMKFDFVYFLEDCCGSSGPLFSPTIYKRLFDRHYRNMIRFYKEHGVPLALIDSDGFAEPMIQCWLDSGFDIIFPIEVGKWGANAVCLRQKFGNHLRMFGGVDKRLIYTDEAALRRHLLTLKPAVDQGGYIPIPDHRITPETSYRQMARYIELFDEVFNKA
ncbi:hypothetical protein FACS1894184_13070 [Clostridia bacterium]|nr:hypothetical protein FACS1894184_13070 [Clostridia bacterium]